MQIGKQDKQRIIQEMEKAYRGGYSSQNEEHWGFTPRLWTATMKNLLSPTTKIAISDRYISIDAPKLNYRHIRLITNALNWNSHQPLNIQGTEWNDDNKKGKLTLVDPNALKTFGHSPFNESINFQRGLDPKDAMGTGDVIHRKLKKIQIELLRAARILVHDLKLDPKTIETFLDSKAKDVVVSFICHGAPERTAFIGFNENSDDRVNQCYAGFEDYMDSTVSYHSSIPECMLRIRKLLEE